MPAPAPLPVYLIHWNAPEWCASAVRSVLASAGIEIDVTVIDNGQLEPPLLRECLPAGVRVIEPGSNSGYSGGANLALLDWRQRYADGQVCVLGSHDLHVEPGALARLAATAERYLESGIVAPVTTGPQPTSGGGWTGTRAFQFGTHDGRGVIERDWASGTCLVVRRACVDDIGDFDERFGSYVEDVDYGLRVRDRGWKVMVDTDARVHGLGATSDAWIAAITTNTVLLGAKRAGAPGAARAFALYAYWMARAAITGVAPWRDAAQRVTSRRYAHQRMVGIARTLTGGRLRAMLRDPDPLSMA